MQLDFNQILNFKVYNPFSSKLEPFELYTHQKLLLQFVNINKNCLILACRQSGTSSSILAYLLLLAQKGGNIIILNQNTNMLESNKFILKKFGIIHSNKNEWFFENGGSISLTTSKGSKPEIKTNSILWIDNYSFVNYSVSNNMINETTDKGGKIILSSIMDKSGHLSQKINDPNYAKMVLPYYAVGVSESKISYYKNLLGYETVSNEYLTDFRV